jgi:probable lipoprotein NlpC
MRILILISILIFLVSCQSAVRYTAVDSGYYDDYDDSQSEEEISSEGQINPARMGKIIAGYLRTPYRKGGRDKDGIDCSGLTYAVYREYNGIQLPLTSKEQYRRLSSVDYDDLSYGDLVFFSFNGSSVSHVGIYVKNGKFVHAAESEGVIVSSIKEKYYKQAYRGARRVVK